MKNTQLQELQKITHLQNLFTDLFILDDDTFKLRNKEVYNTKIQDFNEELKSIGIDPKSTPKEIDINLQQKLEKTQKLITAMTNKAQYEEGIQNSKTTWNKDESAQFQEEARIRNEEITATRDNQTKLVEDFIKQNQERIANAQKIQPELKGKTLYAQVVTTKEQILSKQEEADLNTLSEIANLSQDSRTELIDDLSEKIAEKIRPVMSDATEEEIVIASRSVAIDITEKISTPESRSEIPTQVAILSNLTQSPETQRLVNKVEVVQELEKGSMFLAQHKRAVIETNESITRSLLGNNISKILYGNNPIQVIFTDKFIPGKTTHTIQLEGVNQDNLNMIRLQDSFLTTLQEKGIDHIREVGIGQTKTFINSQIEKAINKLPKENVFKTMYSSETVTLILNRNQLIQQPIFMNTGNVIGSVALRVAPKYAPILTAIGGGSYAAIAASSYAATTTSVTITGGIMVGEAFASGAGGALAGASAGSIVPVLGTAIGAVVGYVGGEVLSKVASRIKVWWNENRDIAAPAVGVGAALTIAPFFGAGPAVLGGVGAFALLGGSVTGLAAGAFGVLGLIGRSVGIAIATPVIVTLLVLPPLVAFIMLVINNSAYVVPPAQNYDLTGSPLDGGVKVTCTDKKGPVGIEGLANHSQSIQKRAYEIVYDLYQGFWCYWNRSPKAPPQYFPNDVLKYPNGYPNVFNYVEYFKDPNTTPSDGNLFWCTLLVKMAYKDSNVTVPSGPTDLNSQEMFNNWPHRKISASDATPSNIVPGSVIFFQVHGEGRPNRINHVAIVYSVDEGGIVFIQSNASIKSQSATFIAGRLSRNIGSMEIKGFGLPN